MLDCREAYIKLVASHCLGSGFNFCCWLRLFCCIIISHLHTQTNHPSKMLAVFDKSVAKSPEGLQSPQSNSVSAVKDGFLAQHFSSVHPGSVTVNLGTSGLLAYSLHKQNPLLPRSLIFFSFFDVLFPLDFGSKTRTHFSVCLLMFVFLYPFGFINFFFPYRVIGLDVWTEGRLKLIFFLVNSLGFR